MMSRMMLRKSNDHVGALVQKDDHAVVVFEDGVVSTVPRRRILDPNAELNNTCEILWTNSKQYTAMLLFIGTREQALEEEQRIVDACESSDEEVEELQSETAVETQPAATANTGTEPVKDKTMATKNRKRKQVKTTDKGIKKQQKGPEEVAKEEQTKSKGKKSNKKKDCNFTLELGSPAHSDEEEKLGGTSDSVLTEIKELRKDLLGVLKSVLDKSVQPPYHNHQQYSAFPSPSSYIPMPCLQPSLQLSSSVSNGKQGYSYQQSLAYPPLYPGSYRQNYISAPEQNNKTPMVSKSYNESTSPATTLCYENEEVPPLPPPIVFPPENSFEVDDSFQNDEDSENISQDKVNDSEGASVVTRVPLKQWNGTETSIGGSPKEPDKVYPITEVFNTTFLGQVRAKSNSRPNFTTLLVKSFFKPVIRMTSNVSGTRGKMQLNKEIMAAIKVATFKMWPCTPSENEVTAWQLCVKAVDAAGRQLYRPKRIKV